MTQSALPTPWWNASRHADRRPLLMARNRIQAGIRGWLVDEGFTEVDPAAMQVSPGNETHLHAFATDAIGNDGQARRLYLHYLSARDELTWVDVTAPGDGCAFALCDPVAVTGVAPADKKWPLVISAAFTQTLSPERWKDLRWRFFRLL